MVKIGNLTPHPITIIKTNGEIVEVKPDGFILRVKENIEWKYDIDGIRIIKKSFESISNEDLEKLKQIADKYDIIIVSLLAGQYIKKLYDQGLIDEEKVKKFYIIGNTVRDEEGRIIGADALSPIFEL